MTHLRPVPALARRLPWQVRAPLGVVAAALGCFLLTSPLDSLVAVALYLAASFLVVGVTDLVRTDRTAADTLAGTCWSVLGLLVLVLPGHAIAALPTTLGVFLLVAGGLKVLRVRAGSVDDRVAALLLGLTQAVLGVLALTWDDLTLVVAAGLFGILLVVSGLAFTVQALLHRDRTPDPVERRRGPLRRWGRVLGSVVALALALGLLAVSGGLNKGAPVIDAFYDPPRTLPAEPGRLLRSEPFTRQVPAKARAWRILYTTTDALGRPTVASGIVLVPRKRGPQTGPQAGAHPVVAWAHGTTGYARKCAPSLLKEPFSDGGFPHVLGSVVARGWAVVATDYAGLGTAGPQPYLIGRGEARSVLDAVRAARELEQADLADRTVVWGHSQGGGAALWTSQEQPSYAPDVPLAGTVAMAPAADPLALARSLPDLIGGTVFGSFVYAAYADTYPDLALADFLRPAAVPLVRKVASRCLSEPGVLASALTALSLADRPLLTSDPGTGRVGALLRENTARSPGPGPLLVAQGLADDLVVPELTGAYVDRLRADGHAVTYRTFPGLNHMPLVQRGSAFLPVLLAWTAARFGSG